MPTIKEMENMSDHDLISQQGLAHMQKEALLQVRLATRVSESIDKLKDSMEVNAKSNDKLSNKVYWLNIILTAATVVGVIVGIAQLFK